MAMAAEGSNFAAVMKKIHFFTSLLLASATTFAQVQRTMNIEELFNMVEQNNASLSVAKQGIDVAKHGITEAKSQRLPDINTQMQLSYYGNVLKMDRNFTNATGFSSPHFSNALLIEAQQTIYSGGALTAGINIAETQKDMAENRLDATRQGQRLMAIAAYLQLMQVDNSIQVYRHNIALTERLIANIKEKRSQGMALKNDITRYELQKEELLLGLRTMQDARQIANHNLCNVVSLPESTNIIPDSAEVYGMIAQLTPAGVSEQEQAHSFVSHFVRESQLNTEMARHQLKLAKSELMPKLSVMAVDNFNGPFNYDIPPVDNNFNVWFVGVGVKYSLSSLFKSNKSIRKAAAALQESQTAQRETLERVDNNVNEATTLYQQAFATLATKKKKAQLAAENYEVINARYLADMALITDMLDASNILLAAQLDEANAQIAIAMAYYTLKYNLGTL